MRKAKKGTLVLQCSPFCRYNKSIKCILDFTKSVKMEGGRKHLDKENATISLVCIINKR